MKIQLGLLAMLACVGALGESPARRYDTAYRLETEEQKPAEAAAIYRELVALDAQGEERHVVALAARRLIALYQQEQPRTMEEKIEALRQAPSYADHVVQTFGEPLAYTDGRGVIDTNNPPWSFSMDYPNDFSVKVSMGKPSLLNLGYKHSGYQVHGLHMGASKEQVFAVFPPDRIEKAPDKKRINGTVYPSDLGSGSASYTTKHGVGFFFVKDQVFTIRIYELSQLRAYTPPAPREVAP